eukprot:gene1507-1744_t
MSAMAFRTAMGSGIAQVAAAAGHTVKLYDTRAEAVRKAIADIAKVYLKLVEKERMTAADAQAATARLQAAEGLAGVAGAALVVEAIVENLDVKRSLFADLEGIVGDECILATNTSSISVTAIAAKLRRPQRLVGKFETNKRAQGDLLPGGFDHFDWAIYDEVHSLDGAEGAALQRLIRSMNCKFLALSATVGNAEELRGWMERARGDYELGLEAIDVTPDEVGVL